MISTFFKKIKERFGIKEQTIEERISLNELKNWIERKEVKLKVIVVLFKERTSLVVEELNEKLKVLEDIDVEQIKVEEKTKSIVKGNLSNYVCHVKDFIRDIDNIKEEELDKIIHYINNIFFEFDQKSHKSYQKATFLIGKEMADIKGSIINFSKDLTKVFDENKEIVNYSKIVSFIKLKLRQIDNVDKTIKGIDERMKFLDEKTENINKMNKEIFDEIEKIKGTNNYIKNLKKEEEIKLNEKEFEEDIYKLKEMIDFKILGNIFHANKKKMSIVKTHKENFQISLKEDGSTNILSLLDEAKLNNEVITSKIKQINNKKEEIAKSRSLIKKDETEDLLAEIERIKMEIDILNNEKSKELNKLEKYKMNRENIINSIKEEMRKINIMVEVEDQL